MTEMTEYEMILMSRLLRSSEDLPYKEIQPKVYALLRTVRATALRDAAKALIKEAETGVIDIDNGTRIDANWLFDRADIIETEKD